MPRTDFGYITPENLTLFTDLYELTMMEGYFEEGHTPEATFSLFFRELPPNRGYMIAAGLEQVLHYMETLSFGDRAIDFLAEKGFSTAFLDHLADLEFTGDARAIPEGTAVFHDEPLLEVTAPIMEAQLLETIAINQISFGSLIATKAARMRDVVNRHGDAQALVDFGSRRAHGTDAGMKAARSSYIGGFNGTSNVAAGEVFNIPIFGTMAHSWIQSFETERAAYEAFVDAYGEDTILLVDTYDTVQGARIAKAVADETGVDISGVRLDSGDLAALSKEVAPIVGDMDLFISSGMDEYRIKEFIEAGGIGNGFGPGTALVTSTDAPKVEGVYKLVAVERGGEMQPSMKLSKGKSTLPGEKTVHRVSENGRFDYDVIGQRHEELPGEELLEPVFVDGELVYDPPSLDTIKERTMTTLRHLPPRVRIIENPDSYDVRVSDTLQVAVDELEASLEEQMLP